MKAHLAKLSLALLSAVFLLGCQEQGSEPVGPEGTGPEFTHRPGSCKGHHKNDEGCGGGGGGADKVTIVDVTVTGGMNTDGIPTQQMQVRDKPNLFQLHAKVFRLAITMTATHGAAKLDVKGDIIFDVDGNILDVNDNKLCFQDSPSGRNDLFAAELFGGLQQISDAREDFRVGIDKRVLEGSSEDHNIFILSSVESVARVITVRDAPTVRVEPPDLTGDFTATFTRGIIELTGNPGDKTPDHVHLSCEIQTGDDITFTVVRPS